MDASRISLIGSIVLASVCTGCKSPKPVPAADVAPVIAAVVSAVDSVVGPKDSLAIDPRILLPARNWRRKPVITDWPQADLVLAINPTHPRLDLGMLAFVCAVRTPGCSATRTRSVLALGMPTIDGETVRVEAIYAARRPDDSVTQIHWLWFAVRKDSVWRVVKHTTLDRM
jgi:hypothetical protein